MGNRNAGNFAKPFSQQSPNVLHAALAQFSIHQTNVNTGAVFALCIGRVHAREGVFNLWKFTHNFFNLFGFEGRAFKRSAHRRLKGQRGF